MGVSSSSPVIAPLGDLTESMFKRNLDIKDFQERSSGSREVFDRFDGYLFVLPAPPCTSRWTCSSRPCLGMLVLTMEGAHCALPSLARLARSGRRPSTSSAPRTVSVRGGRPRGRFGDAHLIAQAASSGRRRRRRPTPPGGRGRRRAARRRRRQTSRTLVEDADVVVNAVVGFAGLPVTITALSAGKRLALANKEGLIAAGTRGEPLRSVPGAELVPVDSEHCGAPVPAQPATPARELARIVLTASGGPFRGRTEDRSRRGVRRRGARPPHLVDGTEDHDRLEHADEQGLEVIEAHELFDVGFDDIEVVVHPQSVVHSMVEYTDGSTIAQLSLPDMRLPIGYALGYPAGSDAVRPDRLGRCNRSTSSCPIRRHVPLPALAYAAGAGGTAPAWLSAANEVAVDAFLAGEISWGADRRGVKTALDRHDAGVPTSVGDVIEADHAARRVAAEQVALSAVTPRQTMQTNEQPNTGRQLPPPIAGTRTTASAAR